MDQAQPLWKNPAVVRLLIAALLGEIAYATLNIATMPVYLRDERGFGESSVALVLVAFLVSEAVLKGPMGALADRVPRRLVMMIGPSLSVVSVSLSFLVPAQGGSAQEAATFAALRILDGAGAAMLWPAAFAAMGDSVDDASRQRAMSLLNLCYLVGVALALPIEGLVNDLSGRKSAGLLLAGGLFALVSISLMGVRVPKAKAPDGATGAASRRLWPYLALSAVTFAGVGFPMPIVKLFAQDQFGLSESRFGALVFPAAIAMALLNGPIARFGVRLGPARSVQVGLGLCAGGLAVLSSGLFAHKIPALGTPVGVGLGAIPIALGFLLAIPAWLGAVSDLDPSRRAANLGAAMTAQGVGAIFGVLGGGGLYEKSRGVGARLGLGLEFARYAPFAACFVCVLAGWLLSFRLLGERSENKSGDPSVTKDEP